MGDDFDEALLGSMADAGGGAFRYIADATQIPGYINDEIGEELEVTARDVALEIAAPDGLRVESLSPYPIEARPGRTVVRLGDLGADRPSLPSGLCRARDCLTAKPLHGYRR